MFAAQLKAAWKDTHEDIDRLKSGRNPDYGLNLTPHVYFMKYFLENVYGAYIAWFLIYKSGLLPTKLNILDIAAGSPELHGCVNATVFGNTV